LRFCCDVRQVYAEARRLPQPEGFSAAAPVCAEIGSDFFESAPPITKTARMREHAPADRGFPLHRVPFLPPAAGFSDTLRL